MNEPQKCDGNAIVGRMFCLVLLGFLISTSVSSAADRPTIPLTMMTGAEITGRLVTFTDELVVLEVDGFPCAIGFDQVVPDSAYQTIFRLRARQRGGSDRLTAADHYAIGLFALRRDRYALAKHRFIDARRLDPSYRSRGDAALQAHRRSRRAAAAGLVQKVDDDDPGTSAGSPTSGLAFTVPDAAPVDGESNREEIIAGYKAVGEQIRQRIGKDLVLLETPRFLIWTDWAAAEHDALRTWCEEMYEVVSRQLGMPPQVNVFAGKCPVFCMRSKKRFRKIARLLDNYDGTNALGYTSSNSNGHTHVVVCRQGGSPVGRDAFAATLVHEATHAFLHRYRSGRRLPAWLNEGLANYVAEAVLGDRCSNAETAAAAARAVIVGNYPLDPIFSEKGPLAARYYPVAHSVVSFLIKLDPAAFTRLIDGIKQGTPTEKALEQCYNLNLKTLETEWRGAHH